jgi:hypothetical protein
MLNATRFFPSLKSNQLLAAFYEKIRAGVPIGAAEAIEIRNLAKYWPLSRSEKIWSNNAFKVLFLALIALGIWARFTALPK